MSEPVDTYDYKDTGIIISIYQDQDVEDPRKNYDHIGTMVCAHRRYLLGDYRMTGEYMPGPIEWIAEHEGLELWCENCGEKLYDNDLHDDEESECEEIKPIVKEKLFILPLYLYDHSGISMSTSDRMFSMFDSVGWDWGCVGFIYMTEAKAKENWPKLEGEELEQAAKDCLVAEVKEYDQFLTGDVYGFVVEDESSKQDDSCWGFFGIEDTKQQAEDAAQYILDHRQEAYEKLEADIMSRSVL